MVLMKMVMITVMMPVFVVVLVPVLLVYFYMMNRYTPVSLALQTLEAEEGACGRFDAAARGLGFLRRLHRELVLSSHLPCRAPLADRTPDAAGIFRCADGVGEVH